MYGTKPLLFLCKIIASNQRKNPKKATCSVFYKKINNLLKTFIINKCSNSTLDMP